MKIVIIDNYDSFTYNLAHLVKELSAKVTVYRNDQFELPQLADFDKIILSPGPGIPSEAGLLLDVIRAYAGKKPILGVCLGHQAIGEVFGGKLALNNKLVMNCLNCKVTCVEPAVCSKGFVCKFRVFVVAFHYCWTFNLQNAFFTTAKNESILWVNNSCFYTADWRTDCTEYW